ncbi:MAG: hypothetical protein LC109_04115 [Bacteroidia bacterium]|nr:hypothetical protein [Bacteroidia bacterium]MCO5254664.1 hypothetical protein [Bacteroidota bacterium]MCZ2129434.1 hypothetical protein [Bacteroidia bacterium]
MKRLAIVLCFALMLHSLQASQEQKFPISISIFNNGTMLPGSGYAGVFSKTIHPGISIGSSYLYSKGKRSELFQTLKLGYLYHQFSQNAIQLYSELGYQYNIHSGLYAQSLLGIGYLHSFVNLQQFKFDNGEYKETGKWGRPQFMGSFSLALGYDFQQSKKLPLDVFLQYQFWLQAPFVNKYVPVLPNSALHLGVRFFPFK